MGKVSMPMKPPAADRRAHVRDIHGHRVDDPWFWLRDRDDAEAIVYLEAENAHTEAVMRHTDEVQQRIFGEIKRRTQETDLSVPARRGAYWYSTRTEEEKPYRIWVRMKGSPLSSEQVLLDENLEAQGHDHFRTANVLVSPNDRILAYSVDTTGAERYITRFRDLNTGLDLGDEIPLAYVGGAWASDSSHYFYTVPDELMRPWQIWRHQLGAVSSEDVMVFEETDERFYLSVRRTRSGAFVVIAAESRVTADALVVPADDPLAAPRRVLPRVAGVEYSVDHKADDFWIVTNEDALDGRLMSMSTNGSTPFEVVAHEPGVKLAAVSCFADHVVVWGRRDGLSGAMIVQSGETPRWLEMGEDVYDVYPGPNHEFESSVLRYGYQSMTTPPSVYDHDLESGERELLKETPVLGGYDRTEYVASREWASARDGARIPVSVVRHRSTSVDGSAPLVIYAYGAYEIALDPWFSIARLSLLDRGVVFAVAHVRGGGELGRAWYEDGKMANKEKTFFDLIDVTEHLIDEGFGAGDRVAIRGASAGGLTVGAAMRCRPDLFRAVVAEVPFVDVVNTMLDEDLPLTVTEWEEWGNPNVPEQYEWLLAYAPYEDLGDVDHYPAILATAGLNDPRVSYWEPAKWVAKMRAFGVGTRKLLLKTEMGAGHFARSGRYDMWEDEAFVLAFILEELGVTETA